MTKKPSVALESMTGFGEARATIAGTNFICRARSVNHRFLDLKIRVPRGDTTTLEASIRKMGGDFFKRGAIEVSLQVENTGGSQALAFINEELAVSYWKAAEALAAKIKGKSKPPSLTMEGLLRLPGVVGAGEGETAFAFDANESGLMKKLIEPALTALRESRLAEGAKLSTHLSQLVMLMGKELGSIKKLEPVEKERFIKMMTERAQNTMAVLSSGSAPDAKTDFPGFAAKLREEAVFWVERRDFEEERMRFEMHLGTFRECLASPEQTAGRKLEFLHQELLREANTLGTKAQSPEITIHAVELKTLLERLKEQLANVS